MKQLTDIQFEAIYNGARAVASYRSERVKQRAYRLGTQDKDYLPFMHAENVAGGKAILEIVNNVTGDRREAMKEFLAKRGGNQDLYEVFSLFWDFLGNHPSTIGWMTTYEASLPPRKIVFGALEEYLEGK